MNKIKMAAILLLFCTLGYSQVTIESNTPTGNTEFLGWDDNNNTPLEVRQNNTVRLKISSIDWVGLNGATMPNAQRMFLSSNGSGQNPPISMLQIGSGVANTLRRPWMHIGTSYTGNFDIMYVGLLERPVAGGSTNATDAVIAWGSNGPESIPTPGPDNFRFLFVTNTSIPGAAAAAEQGKEVARITPVGNFGIGNFSPDGLNQQPTNTLDVDGNARIRQIPQNPGDVLITGKQLGATGDYELRYHPYSGNSNEFLNGNGDWVEVTGGGGGDDMDWQTDGTDVWTGHGAGGYPGGRVMVGPLSNVLNNVKFGVYDPIANSELSSIAARIYHRASNTASPNSAIGLDIINSVPNGGLVRGFVSTSSCRQKNYAGYFSASGLDLNGVNFGGVTTGVYAYAQRAKFLYGVDGTVRFGKFMYAIRGTAPTNLVDSWAMFANGRTFSTTAAFWTTSDRRLKKNIEAVKGGLDIILDLKPKTYEMRNDEFPNLNLETRPQYGLLAQEMEEVLPNSVRDVVIPPNLDENGKAISEEMTVKAVDYQALIPILVAATQEQQELIEQQAAQIAELKDMIHTLHSQSKEDIGSNLPASDKSQSVSPQGHQLSANRPNPFQHSTKLSYSLAKSGYAEVKIFDNLGNLVETLVSARINKGKHEVTWNAEKQAAGIYFYALEVDGEELIRKMVKL